MKQNSYILNNGNIIPKIGLGTWQSSKGEVYSAVLNALKLGYKHIDCAFIYANEEEVGTAIKDAITNKIITREELFVTSKLWCNCHEPDKVSFAIKKSLTSLQLDYLDMYLIHWPVAYKFEHISPKDASEMIPLEQLPIIETWQAMEELAKQGLAKNIGVSNFSIKKLQDLLNKASIKPSNNQVELHPYLQQEELLKFCNNNKILLTAYSPLGSSPRNTNTDSLILLKDEVINEIALKHKATPAQILIAWAIARNTAVIPKSINTERIKQNLDAYNINLSQEDLTNIAKLDKHYRYILGSFTTLAGSSYTLNNLWDEEVKQR